jgi:hypothetical protein
MIFPKGKFKYIWNPDVKDLYVVMDNSDYLPLVDFDDVIQDEIDDRYESIQDDLTSKWEDEYNENGDGHWEYTAKDEDSPFEAPDTIGNHEESLYDLTARLKEQYDDVDKFGFRWEPTLSLYDYIEFFMENEIDMERDRIRDDLDLRNHDYISNLVNEYTDKNLSRAISSGHEIMVVGKDYLAVREDVYGDAIKGYMKVHGNLKPEIEQIRAWYEKKGKRLPRQLSIFKYIPRPINTK